MTCRQHLPVLKMKLPLSEINTQFLYHDKSSCDGMIVFVYGLAYEGCCWGGSMVDNVVVVLASTSTLNSSKAARSSGCVSDLRL